MNLTWKDSIYKQRKALEQILRDPFEQITGTCIPMWRHRESIENLFLVSFSRIPYCNSLYALDTNGIQISESIGRNGIQPGYLGRDRSQQPCLKDAVPAWGFLLTDAYPGMNHRHPTFTALQVIRSCETVLGYIGADFDLCDLPLTAGLYVEPAESRQAITESFPYNPEIRLPTAESILEVTLPVLTELLGERGVFQCQIHFASSQTTVWTLEDPYRYQILDHAALAHAGTLQDYPRVPYPYNAKIPRRTIAQLMEKMKLLHMHGQSINLRHASLNIFNGKIGLISSRDDSLYVSYDDFLKRKFSGDFGIIDAMSRPVCV